jgi:HAD superfamily hydrolase (TIGR01450 family)
MKAIILAAGIGSRLRPITVSKPKILININNKPILFYNLNSLSENGIKEIIICVGYKSELVRNYCKLNFPNLKINFVNNKDFEKTNNMYSLFLAKEFMNDDIILMNGDLVFDQGIIAKLKDVNGTAVAVDRSVYYEESMKVTLDEKGFINAISKKILETKAYGCSIDVYKIAKDDLSIIKSEMEDIIIQQKDKNQWTELMLNNLFESGRLKALPYDIKGKKWVEIDNYDDLAQAEVIFNQKLVDLNTKRIFFLDRDGTLTLGPNKIEGVDGFIQALNKTKKKYFVITNNSSRTPQMHLQNLQKAGLSVGINNILVSTQLAVSSLKLNKLKRVFWVANKKVSEYLQFQDLTYDKVDPQALLLTYDDEIDYQKIVQFCGFVRKGLPYYATHIDTLCPTAEGLIPDIGTFIEMIRATTGKIPDMVFGKPDKSLIELILKKEKMFSRDAVVIGDRLYTDIALGQNADITSILVLSGETKREDYEASLIRADIIVKDISVLIKYLS